MSTKEWKLNHKEEQRAYRRKWYYKNKEHAIQEVERYRRERKIWFETFKSTLKCTKCGESDPVCLDFHHVDPLEKDFAVSHMYATMYSKERILEEIDKCIVLCANCHRKLYYHKTIV
jgi:hypothetical protein